MGPTRFPLNPHPSRLPPGQNGRLSAPSLPSPSSILELQTHLIGRLASIPTPSPSDRTRATPCPIRPPHKDRDWSATRSPIPTPSPTRRDLGTTRSPILTPHPPFPLPHPDPPLLRWDWDAARSPISTTSLLRRDWAPVADPSHRPPLPLTSRLGRHSQPHPDPPPLLPRDWTATRSPIRTSLSSMGTGLHSQPHHDFPSPLPPCEGLGATRSPIPTSLALPFPPPPGTGAPLAAPIPTPSPPTLGLGRHSQPHPSPLCWNWSATRSPIPPPSRTLLSFALLSFLQYT